MSLDDCRGSAYYLRALMQNVQAEIDRGERKGATVLYAKPHPKRTLIGPFAARILRARFGIRKARA